MQTDDLIEILSRAEKAVQRVPESFKVVAYQVVLQELLKRRDSDEEPNSATKKLETRKRSGTQAGTGTTGRLLSLVEEGLFGDQRSLSEIKQMLAERGWHYQLEQLGTPVTRLVQQKRLRRTRIAQGGKTVWKYSNY